MTRLNSRNLDTVMEISCLLSTIEFTGGMGSRVFPLLNNEKCRLFSEALVASKAASYKPAMLSYADLTYVLNGATSALDDPRLAEEVVSGKPRDEMLYALQKFMSRMANIQIRQQETRSTSTAGRLLALLSVLPLKHIDLFPQDARSSVAQFAASIPGTLGASLRDLATIYMFVYLWHQRLGEIATSLFDSMGLTIPGFARKDRQAWIISKLIEFPRPLRDYIYFSHRSLSSLLKCRVSEAAFSAFISLFARPIRDIREEAQKPAYMIGPVGWRLSPLERYPIVSIDNGARDTEKRFMVLNVRTFARSFGDVLHFGLQERFGQAYNNARGAAQEVYIRLMAKERLPGTVVIPEVTYRSAQGERKGPDCSIVEEQSQRLILVEAKARRVLAETRFTMSEEIFDANFQQVYDLFLKLRDKAADLYAGIPEYSTYQTAVDTTKNAHPICVAVVGESVYMMNELIRYRARTEADHPLRDYPWVYCVMSMESFELALEIAASEGLSLAQILEEFWEDGASMEPSSSMSDSFRGRSIKQGSSFAASFLQKADIAASGEMVAV